MFTAQVTFPYGDADREELLEAASTLLSIWYKNGQIVVSTWPMVEGPSEVHAYALIPDRDALEARFANRYGREKLEEITKQAGAPPRIAVLGRDPESLDACSCPERPSYVLFTTYGNQESPVRCGGDWLLEEPWHELFEFRCDACALLSNIACSLAG